MQNVKEDFNTQHYRGKWKFGRNHPRPELLLSKELQSKSDFIYIKHMAFIIRDDIPDQSPSHLEHLMNLSLDTLSFHCIRKGVPNPEDNLGYALALLRNLVVEAD